MRQLSLTRARKRILSCGLMLCAFIGVQARNEQNEAASSKPASNFITVNGVKLHYLDWGGSGDVILFLHSLSWTAYKYEKFAPRFAGKYRVLALTRRGSGLSDKPKTGYDVRTQVEDIKQFLDALQIKCVTLIGNSLPADEMTLFAGLYPERVNKLVFLGRPAWDHVKWDEIESKTNRMMQMLDKLEGETDFQGRVMAEKRSFKPDYTKVKVPVLAFFTRKGGQLFTNPLLEAVKDEPELIEKAKDERLKRFFREVRDNPVMRQKVQDYWNQLYLPYIREQESRFRREVTNLRVVELDIEEVTGYEFENKPDLIALHILKFLAGE